MSRPGILLTLEGPDASGKTTNLPFIKSELEARGLQVYIFRDPGGCEVSEEIRDLLLCNRTNKEQIDKETELLLFIAARIQLCRTKIEPLLKERDTVILLDRFIDSTYAYQGVAGGCVAKTLILESTFFKEFTPDLTIFFNVSLETSLKRLSARHKEYNRLNDSDLEFRTKVFEGYQYRLKTEQNRMITVDAEKNVQNVQTQLKEIIDSYDDWFTNRKAY